MAHNPGFLKLVNEAKSKVKETDMASYKKMVADGAKPVLIDVREDGEAVGQAATAREDRARVGVPRCRRMIASERVERLFAGRQFREKTREQREAHSILVRCRVIVRHR